MANKQSPYADILVAIAAGEAIQWRSTPSTAFQAQGHATTLREIASEEYGADCYRVAPNVNSAGIPRPLKVKPSHGETYYYLEMHRDNGYDEDQWEDFDTDTRRFNSRLIWANEIDAKTAISAIRDLMNT